MNLSDIPAEAFKSKLLDKVVHERLLADLDSIVHIAGVPRAAVWSRLSQVVSKDELEWVRYLRSPSNSGLIFVGKAMEPSPEERMTAIVGACLRNYTDARLMVVQDVVRALKEGNMPECTVLLIPNFCLEKDNGGDLPTWDVTHLMGLLMFRHGRGLKTVLATPSMATVEKQYGVAFRRHIEKHFCASTLDEFITPESLA